jgi:predicted transcriptional regulator
LISPAGQFQRARTRKPQLIAIATLACDIVSKEWQPADLFEVLCSDHARRILIAAEDEPRSAQDLAEHCETSLPTIYRRVNALVEYDLLEESLAIDPSGNHYKTYETNFEQVRFAIEQGGFAAAVDLKRDLVDRFGALWEDLEAKSREDTDSSDYSLADDTDEGSPY